MSQLIRATILSALLATMGQVATAAPIAELEPNNTVAEAESAGITITGSQTVLGSITTVGDKDTYKVVLTSSQVVRFEMYDGTGLDAPSSEASQIRLMNSDGSTLYTDTTSGMRNFSEITVPLAAGTYYIQVEESGNNSTIAQYCLAVRFHTDLGAETESNDLQAMANPVPDVENTYIAGSHMVGSDLDYYAITLTADTSLCVELIEGDTTESAESNGIDSLLNLYNSEGTLLASDDDNGRGFTSKIDGRGAAPLHSGAHALPAGTYYIRVGASSLATGAAAQFNYRLAFNTTNVSVLPVAISGFLVE